MNINDRQKKAVKYINRDFAENRLALINFLKTYFPNQFNDFNEASPQMGLIEAVSYVGGVLSFHTDIQLQESLLYHAEERINLYNLAQSLGYKTKTVVPASVELDVYQLVPAIGSGNNTRPDFRYGLYIDANMR